MLIVVMGVSGAGKTEVGRRVAGTLGLPFLDGDDLHSDADRRKMAAGIPLTDADREPWLREVTRRMTELGDAVVACSALRELHRDVLRGAGDVTFVWLDAPPEVIRARLEARRGHYMPASLLDSQLATLEPPADAIRIDASGDVDETVRAAVAALTPRT